MRRHPSLELGWSHCQVAIGCVVPTHTFRGSNFVSPDLFILSQILSFSNLRGFVAVAVVAVIVVARLS